MATDNTIPLGDDERSFRLLVEAIEDYAIYMLDVEGRVATWNIGAQRNKGYTSSEIIGRSFSQFFQTEDIAAGIPQAILAEAAATNRYAGEGWRVRKDGRLFWASIMVNAIRDNEGRLIGFAKVTRDLTERKKSEALLQSERDRLHVTLSSIADGVICTDERGRVTLMNPSAESLTGWASAEAEGRAVEEVFRLIDPESDATIINPIRNCLTQGKNVYLQESVALLARDGEQRDIQDSAAPIRQPDGTVIGAVLVFQDVTKLRTVQREMAFSATHDSLTLLSNRKQFQASLEEALRRAKASGREQTVCFLDLDRFKIINDTAGHAAGDVLLRTVSRLLSKCVRDSDLVARLGGDEFAIILGGCSVDQAKVTLNKILESIEALEFRWEEQLFKISVSIGVAAVTPDSNAVSVMKQADEACYAAKHAGRNRIIVYEPNHAESKERQRQLRLVADIRHALVTNGFALHAQKIIAMGEHQVPRYELLLRLRGRDGETVSPSEFIAVAERYNLMSAIDRWVFSRVLQDHAKTLQTVPGIQLNINLSASSLNDPKFLPFFLDLLEHSLLPAAALTLEITETALTNHLLVASNVIEKLRSVGCKIALEHFGVGLSSFSYLRNFKVDFIKIEGSFVRNISNSTVDFAIVEAINNISHKIRSQTIAEHVEDETILKMLRNLEVDFAQGFGLGQPQPIEQIFLP